MRPSVRNINRALLVVAVLLAGLVAVQAPGVGKVPGPSVTKTPSPSVTPSPTPPPCNTAPAPSGADDTAALNAWLASVPDGGTGCLPAGAVYAVEGTFKIVQRIDVTIKGNGAEFRASSLVGDTDPDDPKCCVRRHVDIDRSDGTVISDLTVRGANTTCTYNGAFEFEHAFNISGSHGVTLVNPNAFGVGGDFVNFTEFKDPVSRTDATDIVIVNPTFDCNGRQGFAFSGGTRRVLVDGGSVTRVARTLVDIEQIRDDQTTEDVTFRNMSVGFVKNVICCGGLKGTVRNVTFSGNTLPHFRLKVGDIVGVTMEHNDAAPAIYGGGSPWGFAGAQGVVFVDNHAPLAPGTGAVSALSLVGAQMTSCDVFVADSSVLGASAFWPPPGPPGPPGCTWDDGGGNQV